MYIKSNSSQGHYHHLRLAFQSSTPHYMAVTTNGSGELTENPSSQKKFITGLNLLFPIRTLPLKKKNLRLMKLQAKTLCLSLIHSTNLPSPKLSTTLNCIIILLRLSVLPFPGKPALPLQTLCLHTMYTRGTHRWPGVASGCLSLSHSLWLTFYLKPLKYRPHPGHQQELGQCSNRIHPWLVPPPFIIFTHFILGWIKA